MPEYNHKKIADYAFKAVMPAGSAWQIRGISSCDDGGYTKFHCILGRTEEKELTRTVYRDGSYATEKYKDSRFESVVRLYLTQVPSFCAAAVCHDLAVLSSAPEAEPWWELAHRAAEIIAAKLRYSLVVYCDNRQPRGRRRHKLLTGLGWSGLAQFKNLRTRRGVWVLGKLLNQPKK